MINSFTYDRLYTNVIYMPVYCLMSLGIQLPAVLFLSFVTHSWHQPNDDEKTTII